jgi:hypothetical protein
VPSVARRAAIIGFWFALLTPFFVIAAVGQSGARSGAEAKESLYTRAATQSCLTRLPNAVAGLPPATPPLSPVLFVYALDHDDVSTSLGFGQPRPRVHTQLGAWYGDGRYEGIILSFFKSVPAAGVSLKSLAWLYGGKLVRNVVVTWGQKSVPSQSVRNIVLECLRSGVGEPAAKQPPSATVATFAGGWGGHGRGLSISSSGRGREGASVGCCTPIYQMTFQILSVSGTLTRAAAVYRVTSFKHYEGGTRRLHVSEVGKLVLRDGIVTNTLTGDFFCSGPAWGASVTGGCGA